MALKVLFFLFLLRGGRGDVLQYDDEDFNTRMSNHDNAMVMFFAPWCGHCKRLKPEYAKAAEDLSKNDPPVALVKVDCTESGKATCDKFNIDGYPTLKLFRNGNFQKDYKGPRTSQGIVDFMKSYVGPKFKQLSNAEQVANFTEGGGGEEVRIIGFFNDGKNELEEVFMKVVEDLWEKFTFGVSSGEEEIILYRPKLLRNKFEEDQVKYKGSANFEELKKFFLKNSHGLVGIRTVENKNDFDLPLIVAYFDLNYKMNPKGTRYWRNRVLKVAAEYKDKMNFAISLKDDFQDELNEYGLENFDNDNMPLVLGVDKNKKKYHMEEEFSCENLTKFVKDMLEEKIQPKIKSEAIPLKNDDLIKIAVAKNFDEVVLDNGKDTVLVFYAPWCGYCKKLLPVFMQFANLMKDEDLQLVKMDATANDIREEFKVDGYPTLYWLGKEKKKEPVLYEGNKELEDFIKYVARHASEELKGWDRDGNVKVKQDVKEEL